MQWLVPTDLICIFILYFIIILIVIHVKKLFKLVLLNFCVVLPWLPGTSLAKLILLVELLKDLSIFLDSFSITSGNIGIAAQCFIWFEVYFY